MLITKQVGKTFTDTTVYVTGQSFERCVFERCTLVIIEFNFEMEGCRFHNCNWHFNCIVYWGDTKSRSRVRKLLDLIDGAGDAS